LLHRSPLWGVYTDPLDQLKAILQWHADRKNQSLDDWFTRQLHERVLGKRLSAPIEGWARVRLEEKEVKVTEERWSLEELLKLAGWNQVMKPQRTDIPLVIFRGWGQECLIDGNNRLNLWRHRAKHRAASSLSCRGEECLYDAVPAEVERLKAES
jgi:hypothetical protein